MTGIDYSQKILNNVDLKSDKRPSARWSAGSRIT